jgi:hypothetical protein
LVETVAAEKEQAEDLHTTVRRLEAKVDLLATERKHDLHPDLVALNPAAKVGAIRPREYDDARGNVDPNRAG